MAVLIMESGKQSFIDNHAVYNLARNAETVKLVERGPMQRRYALTLDQSSCSIVANVPSDADDLLGIASQVRKK